MAACRPNKIRVIYNLLDIDHFRPPNEAERAAARARWELPAGQRAFMLPGRIGLQKYQLGILWAMRALVRARTAGRPTRSCSSRGASAIAMTSALVPSPGARSAPRRVGSGSWAP